MFTVLLKRESSYGCMSEVDERQKLIAPEMIHNGKNGVTHDDETHASTHCNDLVLSKCNRVCSEQQRNGQMTNLENERNEKLPSLKSALLDYSKSDIDDGSAQDKHSETIPPSSLKICNKETILKEHLRSPVRKMSVLFSKENAVLIEIAPHNPDKVGYRNQINSCKNLG